jgi:hypothetical protein
MGAMHAIHLLPPLVGWSRHLRRATAKVRLPRFPLGRLAGAAATSAIVLQVAAVAAPTPHAARMSSVPMSVPGSLDTIYQSVIVDVVAVAGKGHPLLIALGKGKHCRCWIIFRSANGGSTWQEVAGPNAVPAKPRLEVALAFPTDPRLFIADGPTGKPALQAAALGGPFVMAANPTPAMARVTHAANPGDVAVAPGGLLYIDPGGTVCSRDRGQTWARSCDQTAVH